MTLKWKDSKIIYILIIARTGHDTTAIALSNTVYYLAVNPVWFIRQPNPLEKCKCQSWLTTGITQDIQQNAREVAITVLGDDKEDVYPTRGTDKRVDLHQWSNERSELQLSAGFENWPNSLITLMIDSSYEHSVGQRFFKSRCQRLWTRWLRCTERYTCHCGSR